MFDYHCSNTTEQGFSKQILKAHSTLEALPDCPFTDNTSQKTSSDYRIFSLNSHWNMNQSQQPKKLTHMRHFNDNETFNATKEYEDKIRHNFNEATCHRLFEKPAAFLPTTGRTRQDNTGEHGRRSNLIEKLNNDPIITDPVTHKKTQMQLQQQSIPGYRNIGGPKILHEI